VYINLNPLVAMVLAAMLLAEHLTIMFVAGFGAVLLGVLLVNLHPQPVERGPDTPDLHGAPD
jgi:drug/metabolite transporter (DMT)-like permease